jgi:hypothetical protein
MKTIDEPTLKRDRDVIAAVLSIIPGMGHLYKGHYLAGCFIMLLGIPIGVVVGIFLSLATAGIGLLVPVLFWAMVVVHAYLATDYRKHHPMGVM